MTLSTLTTINIMKNIEELYDELNALIDQRDEIRQKDKRIDFEIDALKRRIKQAEKLRDRSANVNEYF
jgi:predicted nuclease with TOPRIM domain